MLWTAIYFIVLLGVACWYLFDYLFSSRKRPAFAQIYSEPSTANIDQYLPNEIIEHAFTYLDCQSVLNCRSVSKYWKYQASKENVLKEVLDNQRASNRRKFLQQVDEDREVEWLDYSNESSLDQLRDYMFAAKRGATLIELTGKNLGELMTILEEQDWMKSYLVKTVGTHSHIELQFIFTPWRGVLFGSKNRPETKLLFKEFDLIFNLHDFKKRHRGNVDLTELLLYRPHRPLPLIAGFVPTTWAALFVLANYLIPCIFHDWLYSSWITRSWIAALTYIATLVVAIITLFRTPIEKIRTKAVILAAIYFLVLPLIAFKYYYHFSLFKSGVLVAMGVYIVQYEFNSERVIKKKHFYMVEATVLMLYVMIFDWPMISEKIMDGSMLKIIVINALSYITICWEIMWVNFIHLYAWARKQHDGSIISMIFKWDKRTVWGLVKMSIIIVILAFYYPETVI